MTPQSIGTLQNLKQLRKSLTILNSSSTCVYTPFTAVKGIEQVNDELAAYYRHYILRYNHVISDVFKCPDIMSVLEIIYCLMQLHERLVNKQKLGDRFDQVSCNLDKGIALFNHLLESLIVRSWRHPRVQALVDFKTQSDKMFRMNFLLRQYSI